MCVSTGKKAYIFLLTRNEKVKMEGEKTDSHIHTLHVRHLALNINRIFRRPHLILPHHSQLGFSVQFSTLAHGVVPYFVGIWVLKRSRFSCPCPEIICSNIPPRCPHSLRWSVWNSPSRKAYQVPAPLGTVSNWRRPFSNLPNFQSVYSSILGILCAEVRPKSSVAFGAKGSVQP